MVSPDPGRRGFHPAEVIWHSSQHTSSNCMAAVSTPYKWGAGTSSQRPLLSVQLNGTQVHRTMRKRRLVRKRGLEPPLPFGNKLLRLARLPVPPLPQSRGDHVGRTPKYSGTFVARRAAGLSQMACGVDGTLHVLQAAHLASGTSLQAAHHPPARAAPRAERRAAVLPLNPNRL